MLLSALLAMTLSPGPGDLPPPAPREFRGVWVATVDNIDWPSKRNLTTEQQKAELTQILDTCERLNLNAVILQVRPSCDSLYPSKFEPWSEFLTGKQGRAPNPKWDPLKFAVEAAHQRGLELHAWFNPYRAKHPAMKGDLAESHIAKTNPEVVKTYGKFLWLDPGEPLVQKRSMDVIMDVVERYDIDGVHLDDYFYPYPVKDAQKSNIPFPDDKSYKTYTSYGGTLKREDWRRKNVDDFIETLYRRIKKEEPWVKLGISPFGIYRPGVPEGIKAGIDQYADLYADCKKWLREGWCDYFTPQLYWQIKQAPQSYPKLLDWWVAQNVKGRQIWPGNFTGQISEKQANWPMQEILDQIETTRRTKGASGNVHFSMKSLAGNWKGIGDSLLRGPYKEKALVPALGPISSKKPPAPSLLAGRGNHGEFMLLAARSDNKKVRRFLVYESLGGAWRLKRVVGSPGAQDEAKSAILYWSDATPESPPLPLIAIVAMNLEGVESQPKLVRPTEIHASSGFRPPK